MQICVFYGGVHGKFKKIMASLDGFHFLLELASRFIIFHSSMKNKIENIHFHFWKLLWEEILSTIYSIISSFSRKKKIRWKL